MADTNYDPNARYDNGPSAAGSSGLTVNAASTTGLFPAITLNSTTVTSGLQKDGTLKRANHRVGFNAIGVKSLTGGNTGGNVIGAPRSVNNT